MLLYNEELSTLILVDENYEDTLLYRSSFIPRNFHILANAIRKYSALVQRRTEHDRVVSYWRDPSINADWEWKMKKYLEKKGVIWDKVFVLSQGTTLEDVLEVFRQKEVRAVGEAPFHYTTISV